MDNKQKGNLAVASAIKHFVSAGYTVSIPLSDTAKFILCANGRAYAIPFQEIADQTTVNVGRESKWSKWEQYLLPGAGD